MGEIVPQKQQTRVSYFQFPDIKFREEKIWLKLKVSVSIWWLLDEHPVINVAKFDSFLSNCQSHRQDKTQMQLLGQKNSASVEVL